MSFFKKKTAGTSNGGAKESPAEAWPFPNHAEAQLRALMAARVRYVSASDTLDAERADLSSMLVELGQTLAQRLALRSLWREEVYKFNEAQRSNPTKKGNSEWFN